MISDEDAAVLADIAKTYGITETSPIKLVSDGSKDYHKYFQPSGIPSIFIDTMHLGVLRNIFKVRPR